MSEQNKQATEAAGTVQGPWDEFNSTMTWTGLLDEIGETLAEVEAYWSTAPGKIDPTARLWKDRVTAFYGQMQSCRYRQDRPKPEAVEHVLRSIRHVRKAIPAS
ncbi:MAG: hypothetical protein NTAFB01_21130 [Nitrospira sp.]